MADVDYAPVPPEKQPQAPDANEAPRRKGPDLRVLSYDEAAESLSPGGRQARSAKRIDGGRNESITPSGGEATGWDAARGQQSWSRHEKGLDEVRIVTQQQDGLGNVSDQDVIERQRGLDSDRRERVRERDVLKRRTVVTTRETTGSVNVEKTLKAAQDELDASEKLLDARHAQLHKERDAVKLRFEAAQDIRQEALDEQRRKREAAGDDAKKLPPLPKRARPATPAEREALASRLAELDQQGRDLTDARLKIQAARSRLHQLAKEPAESVDLAAIQEAVGDTPAKAAEVAVRVEKVVETRRESSLEADVLESWKISGSGGNYRRTKKGGEIDPDESSGIVTTWDAGVNKGVVSGQLAEEEGNGNKQSARASFDAKNKQVGLGGDVTRGKKTGSFDAQIDEDGVKGVTLKGASQEKDPGKEGNAGSLAVTVERDKAGFDGNLKNLADEGKREFSLGGGGTISVDVTPTPGRPGFFTVTRVLSGRLAISGKKSGTKDGGDGGSTSAGASLTFETVRSQSTTRVMSRDELGALLGHYRGLSAKGQPMASLDEWRAALQLGTLRRAGDSNVSEESNKVGGGLSADAAGDGVGLGVGLTGSSSWGKKVILERLPGDRLRLTVLVTRGHEIKADGKASVELSQASVRYRYDFSEAEQVSFELPVDQPAYLKQLRAAVDQADSLDAVKALSREYRTAGWRRKASETEEMGGRGAVAKVGLDVQNTDRLTTDLEMKDNAVDLTAVGGQDNQAGIVVGDRTIVSEKSTHEVRASSKAGEQSFDVVDSVESKDLGDNGPKDLVDGISRLDGGLIGAVDAFFTTSSNLAIVRHVGPGGVKRLVARAGQSSLWKDVPGRASAPRAHGPWIQLAHRLRAPRRYGHSSGQGDLYERIRASRGEGIDDAKRQELMRQLDAAMQMQALAAFARAAQGATRCLNYALNHWNESASSLGAKRLSEGTEIWGKSLGPLRGPFTQARSEIERTDQVFAGFLNDPNGMVGASGKMNEWSRVLSETESAVARSTDLAGRPEARADMLSQISRLKQSSRVGFARFRRQFNDRWGLGNTGEAALNEHAASGEEQEREVQIKAKVDAMKGLQKQERGLQAKALDYTSRWYSGFEPWTHGKAQDAMVALFSVYRKWWTQWKEAKALAEAGVPPVAPAPDLYHAAQAYAAVYGVSQSVADGKFFKFREIGR